MKKPIRIHAALAFLFGLLALTASHSTAEAAPVLRNGIYIIQMADSDMTVAATREAQGSPMILWPYRPTATWEFKHVGNDVYTVRTNASMLDGARARQSSPVVISPSRSSEGQRWKLKRVGQFYQFINMETGLAMELGNGSRTKGSKLHAGQPGSSHNQLFCIQKPRDPRYCGGGGSAPGKLQERDPVYELETNFSTKK